MMMELPRLLAVASGGGHWFELLRLRTAFRGWDVAYASTWTMLCYANPHCRFHLLPEATRFTKQRFLKVAWSALRIVARERPHAVVTTGSAPALFVILFARAMGAQTLWIDSLAQADGLSTSGRIARLIAHRVVAQWPDAADRGGVDFWGGVA